MVSPFVNMWNGIIAQHNQNNPNDQRQYVGMGSQGFMPVGQVGGYMGQQSGVPNFQQMTPEMRQQYLSVLQRTGKLGALGQAMQNGGGQNGRF